MTVSRSILDIWVVQSQGILTPTFECESVCKCLCAKLQLLEFRLIQLFKDLKHTPLTHSCERYLSQTINKTSTTARCHVFVKFPVNFAPSDFPEYSRNWIDKQGSEIHTLMFNHNTGELLANSLVPLQSALHVRRDDIFTYKWLILALTKLCLARARHYASRHVKNNK